MFAGNEAEKLLDLDLPGLVLQMQQYQHQMGLLQQQQQQPALPSLQEAQGSRPSSVADAARSVLAALGSPLASPAREGECHVTVTPPPGTTAAGAQPAAASVAQREFSPPPGFVFSGGIPLFVDAITGQVLHAGGCMAMPAHWGNGGGGGAHMMPFPGQPLQFYSHPTFPAGLQQQLQFALPQYASQFGGPTTNLPGVFFPPAPAPDPPSPRKPRAKRRRSTKAPANQAETLAQQCANVEQGFTYE